MDLIREILQKLEEHNHGYAPQNFSIDGFSDEQVGYHIYLMGEAGLLKTHNVTSSADMSPNAIASGLTWEGHEFIDAARNDAIWKKTMSKVAGAGGSLTFDIIKEVLKSVIRDAIPF